MTVRIDRRSLVLGGSMGLGALLLPGGAHATASLLGARGFTHNVASGEPGPDSILLWTRYVPANGADAALAVELSETPRFERVVAGGRAMARADADFTARTIVGGLEPGRWYYYRFAAPDGAVSPIGRTRTLPAGPCARFGLGVFSCSNLPFGWFNAYAHAAARDDLDLMVHLGDYLYEYPRGTYPKLQDAVKGRIIDPPGELLHLADYRLRYAGYRADPDLQRIHQLFPMIAQIDDHEVANNSWTNGAENHQGDEGDFAARKAAALQAWHEWLPVSDAAWSRYEIGDLATLLRPETRVTGRSRELKMSEALKDRSVLEDPARTMMGLMQEKWVTDTLAASVKRGARWQILAQQTNMGRLFTPPDALSLLAADAPDYLVAYTKGGIAATKAGIAGNLDDWGGFPASRARILAAGEAADADLVVLSGDSHNGWAFELPGTHGRAGVEFGGHSVSSPGYEAYLTATPDTVARMVRGSSPELKWADTSHRGYMTIEITPDRVNGEWVFMETVRERSQAVSGGHRMSVLRGARAFAA
ncbi:alkaline phosphatase D family protein [Sphingomonas colocasiae]|uniref:Alkaline phosphatase D family protein n=1 Tax=Sphingomonas colocasiae TaxID=1848973 RepID=A0ABS7PTP4_9SPHN|nr:alkaline phosphatase D family protein [Sphingomonas colocasiae]MBY8824707.1 alkaline phosphatase D family protein [Sphingomonas colocasiae]